MQSDASTAVAPEQPPSPIRVCKGPGCTHPIGPGRGPTAIYCSDRCNWRAQNAKKKLSRDAENPHRRTVRRLTPEESEKIDQRLRELCKAKTPGTEIRKILNSEFDLPWGLHAYIRRVKHLGLDWIRTPLNGRSWAGAENLPEDQRAACYEDPVYEARKGIFDRVICRECFKMFCNGAMDGKDGHLWTIHRKDLGCEGPEEVRDRYRLRNPGAPLFTWQAMAEAQHRDVIEYMAKKAEEYATPEVRATAHSDPEYEEKYMRKYAICRKLRCGFKSRNWLTKHLANAHDIHGKEAVKEYRRQHVWAPVVAPDAAKKKAKEVDERNKRLRKDAEIGRQTEKTKAPKPNREEKTTRITLAAYLSIEELSKGEMKFQLYPKQNIAKAAKIATKVFFSRNKEAIELEKTRLLALPESERRAEAERARIILAS